MLGVLMRILGAAIATLLLLELSSCALLSAWDGPGRAGIQSMLGPVSVPSAGGRGERLQGPGWMREHILHPYLGFVRDPGLQRHRVGGLEVGRPVNEFGFFGESPSADTDGAIVVALFGGSVAAELFLRTHEALQSKPEEVARANGARVRIVSLALDGMKQPQQLLAMSYFLARGARFDVVINLDGYNEVALPFAENAPFGVSPDYPRSWRAYAARAQSAETLQLLGRLALEEQRSESLRVRFSSFPLRHSSFCLALWHGLNGRSAVEIVALEKQLRDLLRSQRPGPAVRGPSFRPGSDELLEDLVALWARASRQMANLARANGAAYFHFLQPNQYVAGAKTLTERERKIALSPPGDLYRIGAEQGYSRLIAAGRDLADEGIAFVDLTSLFADVAGDRYGDHCCHYNREGYEQVAAEIGTVVANSAAFGRILEERRR